MSGFVAELKFRKPLSGLIPTVRRVTQGHCRLTAVYNDGLFSQESGWILGIPGQDPEFYERERPEGRSHQDFQEFSDADRVWRSTRGSERRRDFARNREVDDGDRP